jgi:hypothetical protein
MWNVEAKVIADNNKRGNWNHLKVTQTVPEQLTGKAQDRGTTESSHIGHCRHTAGSADVEVQYKTFTVGNNSTCSTDCEHRTAARLYIHVL